MADPAPTPDSDLGEGTADPGRGSPPGAPRWVKVAGIVAVVLALLVAAVLIFGGGGHGPARHGASGAADSRPPGLNSFSLDASTGGGPSIAGEPG